MSVLDWLLGKHHPEVSAEPPKELKEAQENLNSALKAAKENVAEVKSLLDTMEDVVQKLNKEATNDKH